MNRSGRFKFYMTVGLSILLVIQILIFIGIKGIDSQATWSLATLIVVIAIVAVVMSYKGIQRIKQRVINLPESYKQVYMDAQEAIGLSSMTKTMKQDTTALILEIFEHANLDNRDVEEVIGGNLNSFLEPFIQVGGGKNSALYYLGYSCFLFIMYLLFIKLYKVTRVGFSIEGFKTEYLDFGITFVYGVIAFGFFPWLTYVMRKASRERWTGLKRVYVMLPFILPFGLMIFLILVRTPEVMKMLDQPVKLFPSVFHFLLGVLVMILCIFWMKWEQKRQISKTIKD